MSSPPLPPRQALLVLPCPLPSPTSLERAQIGGQSAIQRLIGALRAAGFERFGAADAAGDPIPEPAWLPGAQDLLPERPALAVRAGLLLDRPALEAFLRIVAEQPESPQLGRLPGAERPALAYLPAGLAAGTRRELLRRLEPGAATAPELTPSFEPLEVELPGPELPRPADPTAAESDLVDLAHPSSALSRFLFRPAGRALAPPLARAGVPSRALAVLAGALALTAAALVALPHPRLILGGALFVGFAIAARLAEAVSLLAGDGRGSRLAPLVGVFGRWAFFTALGVAALRLGDSNAYLWGLGAAALVGAYHLATLSRFLTDRPGPAAAAVRDTLERRRDLPARLILGATRFADEDAVAAAAGIACIAGAAEPLFALAVVAGAAWALLLPPALGVDAGRARSFLVYAAGLGLLAFLVSRMPVDAIFASLDHVGAAAFWVFGLALFYYFTLALALAALLGRDVPLSSVLYATFVGNAYNQILPLAGLGGEPYKIKLLSAHVPLDRASQSVVTDRLLHAVPGPLFGGLLLPLSLYLVPSSGAVTASIAIASAVLLAIAAVLLFASLSRFPTRITASVLERLSALEMICREPIPRSRIAAGFGWKIAGQLFNLFEVWVIFRLLGFAGSPDQVIAVSAAIFASSAIFFVFPQGLGVNEAGITGAFALLGLPPALGLTFGLIRRGRLVLWALLGLALHLGVMMMRRLSAEQRGAAGSRVAAAEEPTL